MTVQDAQTNFSQLYAAQRASGSWLRQQQEKGWQRFQELGLPSRKLEDWKYTSLTALAKQAFAPSVPAVSSGLALRSQLAPYYKAAAVNLVFNHGAFDQLASVGLEYLPAGLQLALLTQLGENCGPLGPEQLTTLWQERREHFADHGFYALNEALAQEGVVVTLSAAAAGELPALHLIHLQPAKPAAEAASQVLRHTFVLEAGAALQLWETYLSVDAQGQFAAATSEAAAGALAGLTSAVIDIELGEGAQLYHYKVQAEAGSQYHMAHTRVSQAASSHYESFNLGVGSKLARHSIDVRQLGPAAETVLRGLYLGRGEQQCEQRTAVVHLAEAGRSSQYYKGILDDKARGVFLGQVHVAKDAQKIAARQLNKNLLLSRQAEVDTKPVLEIDADDVKCSHGATVSQLREDELFYLTCRGIRPQAAKAMLARGFAEELLYDLPRQDEAFVYLRGFLTSYFSAVTGA